jgi:hypothetical protein
MQALAASCEELRARTGNPPLKRDSHVPTTSDRGSFNPIDGGGGGGGGAASPSQPQCWSL